MSEQTKTCINCFHREGSGIYARCTRTGFYTSTELTFGGRCAGPKDGVPKMNLWEPRPITFWMRLTNRLTTKRESSRSGAPKASREGA